MPDFDGKGPLKRGRIFGRGRGKCPEANRMPDDPDQTTGPETTLDRKRS